MLYVFFSSVFIALFFVAGTIAFYGYLELWGKNLPFSWTCFQHVIILAVLAVLCFIAAILFGIQIPDCYATTIL